MEFYEGQINTFGPKDQFLSAFGEATSSALGSAEIGLIKDFVPRWTYRIEWEYHVNGEDAVLVPGTSTGYAPDIPGIRIYGEMFKGATNGDVVKWSPLTIYETHNKGTFVLPQGSNALAVSLINMDTVDNVKCLFSMFGYRLAPIDVQSRGEPWE